MGGGEWSRVESSEVEADDVAGSVLASFPAIDLGRGGVAQQNGNLTNSIPREFSLASSLKKLSIPTRSIAHVFRRAKLGFE